MKFYCLNFKWKQNEKNEKLTNQIKVFKHYKKYNSDRKKQTSNSFEREKKIYEKMRKQFNKF